jgi:cellulose synthase (UDP-forming)
MSSAYFSGLTLNLLTAFSLLFIINICPNQKRWSRLIVVTILLALAVRYVLWRISSTLDTSTLIVAILSLFLLVAELFTIISDSFQTLLVLKIKSRKKHSEKNISIAEVEPKFNPSVDIYIPTYNEPDSIVKRTIIGCQALTYQNKKIYLLDDTQRHEMKLLANVLGCEYIGRKDNFYAKAGNINNALAQSSGELIIIFDADFIPTTNFIENSVGFFQNQEVALVQTNQSYYNSDPIARNLGIKHLIPHEAEMFSSHYQLLRDGVEASGCYGTSVVIRRSSLEEVGGFVTESITEDYFTGVKISALGYKIIYLNEKLSAGLSAEDMPSHLNQRLRWGRGTLQAFFIKSNPITIAGLTFIQKITHLEGLLHWFSSIPRICFLMIPVAYTFLGTTLVDANQNELLYFCLPYYLNYLITYSWLHQYTRSFLLSDLYSVIHCVPLALNSIQVMLEPFSQGFTITPKGISRDKFIFNWSLAYPLILLIFVEIVSLFFLSIRILFKSNLTINLTNLYSYDCLSIMWIFYNISILGIAITALLDVPTNGDNLFDVNQFVEVNLFNESHLTTSLKGRLTCISENQAKVVIDNLSSNIELYQKAGISLNFANKFLFLGQVTEISYGIDFSEIHISFNGLNIDEYRKLIEFIYCQPGRWKQKSCPRDWIWILALFKNLINRFSLSKVSRL